MTYVWKINCHKWRNVGLIGLWIGTTIGLGYFLYFVCLGIHNDEFRVTQCNDNWDFKKQTFDTTTCTYPIDYSTMSVFLGLALAINGGNWFMIWRTLNNHFRWLEVKCISK